MIRFAVVAALLTLPAVADAQNLQQQMQQYYPARARQLHVEGRATVRCVVTRQRSLTSCATVREYPAGFGFADASVKVAERLIKVSSPAEINAQTFQRTFIWKLPVGVPPAGPSPNGRFVPVG